MQGKIDMERYIAIQSNETSSFFQNGSILPGLAPLNVTVKFILLLAGLTFLRHKLFSVNNNNNKKKLKKVIKINLINRSQFI